MPHVWFRFDLSGTPPHLRPAVGAKNWMAVKRLVAKDVRDCGGLLDEFWIEELGDDRRNGRALVHVRDQDIDQVMKCLQDKWQASDESGAAAVLRTAEDLAPDDVEGE